MQVTLVDVMDRALTLTNLHLLELERRGKDLTSLTVVEMQQISGMVAKMQRALAGIAHEARRATKEARDAAAKMSAADKRATIIEFFGTQSPEHQLEIAQQIMRTINAERAV